MTLKYRDQICPNTSKIIPRLISLPFSVCRDYNIMDLLRREHHEISAETDTADILNIASHLNIVLNTICVVYIRTECSVWYWTVTLS